MANTQTKKRSFIVMLVAIIVVAAAIAFVVFDEVTSKSDLIENGDFAFALSDVLGKAPAFITEEDLAAVKYVELNYDVENDLGYIAVGYDEFLAEYKKLVAAAEAGEDTSNFNITNLFKDATFELKDGEKLDDIKYFTGVDTINSSSVKYTDSSVFAGMTAATSFNVVDGGLTEIAGLANLNLEAVEGIDLTGNNITDWSVLDSIKDKVIVNKFYSFEPKEDGTIDFNNMTLVEQTLTEYYEEKAAAEAEAEKTEENTEETAKAEETTENTETVTE